VPNSACHSPNFVERKRVATALDSMKKFLSENETVQFCVKTVRDVAVFTDKRVLIADKQGFTGKK